MKVKHKVVEKKDYFPAVVLFFFWTLLLIGVALFNSFALGIWGLVITIPMTLIMGIKFEKNGFTEPIILERIKHEIKK